MATQTVTETQCRLEIHHSTEVRLPSQGGPAEGFLTDVSPKAITDSIGHGEANPINRNAVPEGQRSEGCTSIHEYTSTTTLDPPHRLHQTREHRGFLVRALWP